MCIKSFWTENLRQSAGGISFIVVMAVLVIAGISGCNPSTQRSYQFYDSHPYKEFVQHLDASGIQYKAGDQWTVLYADSEHARVMQLVDKVMARYYSDCSGSFQDNRRQQALKSRLRKRRIPFRIVQMDDGEKLVCDPGYTEDFNSVYRSVLRRYR